MARGTVVGEQVVPPIPPAKTWWPQFRDALESVPEGYRLGAISDAAHEALFRGRLSREGWERIISVVCDEEVRNYGPRDG